MNPVEVHPLFVLCVYCDVKRKLIETLFVINVKKQDKEYMNTLLFKKIDLYMYIWYNFEGKRRLLLSE